MAAANPPATNTDLDVPVSEKELAMVARKMYPEHLEEFAIRHLGIEHAEFKQIEYDAGRNAFNHAMELLLAWYRRPIKRRTLRDLSLLLEEAERLEFVQKGTRDELFQGKATHHMDTSPYPDFQEMLKSWYTDVAWLNLLLFPWMENEEALLLSNAYTDLVIHEQKGRGVKRTSVPLDNYRDLFPKEECDGTRILVKGDQGTGKTTFTKKIAFDWAKGQLGCFDTIFAVKLRHLVEDKCNTLESLIKTQIPSIADSNVSEDQLAEYLRSGKERVLLILDGLDEIKLDKYPKIQEVLHGKACRKCCILVTSTPSVVSEIQNKMTRIATINGFVPEKMDDFLSHIIPEDDLEKFKLELKGKKLSDTIKTPLLLQALALVFRENEALPRTFTKTYEKLIDFQKETCQNTKGISEQETRKALAEISKLAFHGLTKEDQQLVFSKNDIKDDNIFQLGILAGQQTMSGFKQITTLEFPHKMIQVYFATSYIATRLNEGDRGPWVEILEMFGSDVTIDDDPYQPSFTLPPDRLQETIEKLSSDWDAWTNSFDKLPSNQISFGKVCNDLKGFIQRISSLIEECLDDDSACVFRQIMEVMEEIITITVREAGFSWMEICSVGSMLNNEYSSVMFSLVYRFAWVAIEQASFLVKMEPYRILFKFVFGKLDPNVAHEISNNIVEVLVQNAVDRQMGYTLSLPIAKNFLKEVATEIEVEGVDHELDLAQSNLLRVDLSRLDTVLRMKIDNTHSCGTMLEIGNIGLPLHRQPHELITNVAAQLQKLKIISCKLTSLTSRHILPASVECLAAACCQPCTTCLQLHEVDTVLVKHILKKLPPSLISLTITKCELPNDYSLPQLPNLVRLVLSRCQFRFCTLFRPGASFPELKVLELTGFCGDWHSLKSALAKGQLPNLKAVLLSECRLEGSGSTLVDILSHDTLRMVVLAGTETSDVEDQELIRAIQQGKLDHLKSLIIATSAMFVSSEEELRAACSGRNFTFVFENSMDFDSDKKSEENSDQGSWATTSSEASGDRSEDEFFDTQEASEPITVTEQEESDTTSIDIAMQIANRYRMWTRYIEMQQIIKHEDVDENPAMCEIFLALALSPHV